MSATHSKANCDFTTTSEVACAAAAGNARTVHRWPVAARYFLLALFLCTPTVMGEESNRNEVRAQLEQSGWRVIWGKNFTEADWARGTKAIAESVGTDNPAPFLAWFQQTLDENFTKMERNLKNVTRRDLERWVTQSLREKKIITYQGFKIQAGFATYKRWERIIYNEPRTRRVKQSLPFGGWTWSVEAYTEQVEKVVPLPNWHQFYIRYQLVSAVGMKSDPQRDHSGDIWRYRPNQFTRGGYFKKSGQGWVEIAGGRVIARFRQTGRNNDTVFLFDSSRDMHLSLGPNRAHWRVGTASWNYLYDRTN